MRNAIRQRRDHDKRRLNHRWRGTWSAIESRFVNRRGSTLMEVLISILIMSLGVVTLATLFPISMLRSIQATQLTNATILRFNAESMVRTLPYLVHDPDRDGDYLEHVRRPDRRVYVVDPLGFWMTAAPNLRPRFGNDGAFPAANPAGNLLRFSGGTTSEDEAARLVMLPDSWVQQADDIPLATTATSVTFPDTVDFNGTVPCEDMNADGTLSPAEDLDGDGNNDVFETRVTLFSADGRHSLTRTVSRIRSAAGVPPSLNLPYGPPPLEVDWTTPVPASFGFGAARVETQERRYTWFLTVRRRPDGRTAGVDAVVCFRRSFSPQDEIIFGSSVASTSQFTAGNRVVRIEWSDTMEDPNMKKGGWIMDAENGRWYRIQDISEDAVTPPPPAGMKAAELVVENDIQETGNSGAILMSGVVQVFPLGLFTRN